MPRLHRSQGWLLIPLNRASRTSRYPRLHPFTARLAQPHLAQPLPAPKDGDGKESEGKWKEMGWKAFESGTTTVMALVGLGLAGYGYNIYYKQMVLDKIENAFSAGYSSNELVALGHIAHGPHESWEKEYWMPRAEQPLIDSIIKGEVRGRYYLIVGEKGTGKASLMLDAMRKTAGDGIAMLEAHSDLEVFRVRLGKAIDFEYHEDYVGSLFSIKGPRDATPLLDIERALNKLEKVALKLRKERGRPLVLVLNNIHLFKNDTDGQAFLELLQQRAETWAGTELATVVLTSDEYWTLERLKPGANHLQIINVPDIPRDLALESLRKYRHKYHNEDVPQSILDEVYRKIGGRLIFLNHVAKSDGMLEACKDICDREKAWLLNQTWIYGKEMDDDAEEQQTFCAAALVLGKALVERETTAGVLPEIPLHEARQLMTRAEFVQRLDHANVLAIDSSTMVRADSVPMQNAFREIVTAQGFDAHLQATLERLDELESLGRTRELVLKDLREGKSLDVEVGGEGGKRAVVRLR